MKSANSIASVKAPTMYMLIKESIKGSHPNPKDWGVAMGNIYIGLKNGFAICLQWFPDGDGIKNITSKINDIVQKPTNPGFSILFMTRNIYWMSLIGIFSIFPF